jgi:peptide-methionine (S)-S-oxide reductase
MSAETNTENVKTLQKATFGAGCFWGVEETFRQVPGVVDTAVGYEGGTLEQPSYRDVCTDRTGHAEVVEVTYDPAEASYEQLLDVFWNNHNPTQLNRQGPDYGTQYRSVIFYHTPEQREAAEASKAALEQSGKWKRPIVTQIVPAQPFYRAEEYHQQYLAKRGLSNCHI